MLQEGFEKKSLLSDWWQSIFEKGNYSYNFTKNGIVLVKDRQRRVRVL